MIHICIYNDIYVNNGVYYLTIKKNEIMSFSGNRDHHAEQDKPSSKGQTSHVLDNLWNLNLQ
jgi:hypothetical protein